MNESETCTASGTNLTRPDSLDVHGVRKHLDAMRAKFGADTPAGHRCSNLLEQLKNLYGATGEQRKHLEKSISQSVAELAKLSSGTTPHAEERGTP